MYKHGGVHKHKEIYSLYQLFTMLLDFTLFSIPLIYAIRY